MEIITNEENFQNDFFDILRLFFPNEKDVKLTHYIRIESNKVINDVEFIDETATKMHFEDTLDDNSDNAKKYIKRFAKSAVYKCISKNQNIVLPWGSLTGVRPTKLAYDLIDSKQCEQYLIKEYLIKNFCVSDKKASIVSKILQNQKCIIKNDNLIDLYINIPFCPSRCSYCSFISSQYDAIKSSIPIYIECLIKELKAIKEIIKNKALVVRTIYIGGGTPTTLSVSELKLILDEITFPVNEFTVECGRPDTITKEKLDLLSNYGVTRICINPQTFNDKILKQIGRNHTSKDIIEAYKLALNYDFNINMDFIAGLPNETFNSFKKSITTALELSPDNITIHTLSYKVGSQLNENEKDIENELVQKIVDYAYEQLSNQGYKPYYLYRQKNQKGGLENIGYALNGKVCIFNIDSMEETCSVIACGANAISKRIFNSENRIERCANVKFLKEYIERIDELIERKKVLFK